MDCPVCNIPMDKVTEVVEIEFEHTLYPTNALVNVCPNCGKRILGPSRITPENAAPIPTEKESEPVPEKEKKKVSPLWERVVSFARDTRKTATEKLEEKTQEAVKVSGSDVLAKSLEKLQKNKKSVPASARDTSLPIGKVVIDDMIFDPEACELFFQKDMPVFGNRILKTFYYKTQVGSFVKITKDPSKTDYTFTKISEKEVKKLLARDVDLYEKILGTKLDVYGTVPETKEESTERRAWREEDEPVPDEADESPAEYTEPSSEECQPSPIPETSEEEGGDHAFDQFEGQDQDPFDGGDEYPPLC